MQHLCRILIIDDESILRHGLKHLCNWEEEGFYIVGEASNGEQALKMINKLKPHIIITDVVMPVMDGVEFSKVIYSLYPDIKIIILSSFNKFDYVKETFKHGVCDYLLKASLTADDLLESLKKARSQTTWNNKNNNGVKKNININHVIEQFINGVLSIGEPQTKILNNYFTKRNFIICECDLDFLDYTQDISKDEFEKDIAKFSKHYLSNYIYSNIFLNDRYILIINFDDDQSVRQELNDFTFNLKNSFNLIVFVSSNTFPNIKDIPSIHTELTELLPKTFYFDDQHFIHSNTLLQTNKVDSFDFNLFKTHIKNLKFEMADNILKTYFNDVKHNLALDDYSFKRFCQNILYSTLNICDELGFDVSDINKSKIKLFKTIDLATSFYNLKEIVFNFLEKISKSINLQAEQKDYVIVSQIKQYVHENYKNDISLTDIASALHINYYYLSSYFKTHTNENLSTYINKVRIEKAKILLQDKSIPISRVSEMVGFSEHNYFSKVFKKHTNLTPTRYRRKGLKS